jgi:hypothetical protein
MRKYNGRNAGRSDLCYRLRVSNMGCLLGGNGVVGEVKRMRAVAIYVTDIGLVI